jgi:quercetin dioxygenase-like cupin family protein
LNRGAHYPAHVHPDKIEYAIVVEGNPNVTVADKVYAAKQGDVFVFPKGVNHTLGNTGNQVAILLTGAVQIEELV